MDPKPTQPYKRPESVLVLIYTSAGEVLLLERTRPVEFWQSVTGSLEWHEAEPLDAACRELSEETGIVAADGDLIDCQTSVRFPIKPAWRGRYAPGVTSNLEHWFRIELADRQTVVIDPAEHRSYCWLSRELALERATSYTNRKAIKRFV